MSLEIMILLAMVCVLAIILTGHHIRVDKLRRQENANIHKRRDVTPPLMRSAEASDA